jgi:hypothetical protein
MFFAGKMATMKRCVLRDSCSGFYNKKLGEGSHKILGLASAVGGND